MKKLAIISLVLLVAMGITGIGYATWSQNLTTNGKVNTGTFDTQLVNPVATNDQGGIATALVVTPLPVDGHSFTINLSNLFPGSEETVTFGIKNNGSVPAKIKAIYLNGNTSLSLSSTQSRNIDIGGTNGTTAVDVTISVDSSNGGSFAVGDTIGVNATKSGCRVTINSLSTIDSSVTNGSFTVNIDTEQGN